jgi:hypothetical protein
MDSRDMNDLTLSPESIQALEEHKRLLDDDIAAGRFKPGDRRCVVLPNGDRFQLGHPEQVRTVGADVPKLPWWRRLLGQR